METKAAYKLTGFVVLILGILFFLRDIGINLIGDTSGWTIIIVLVGAGLLAGENELGKAASAVKSKGKKMM